MILALAFPATWGELAALAGLISAVSGLLGGIGLLWLNSRFTTKKLHYFDKDKVWGKISEIEADYKKQFKDLDDRVEKLERESELAKQPIITMEAAVSRMSSELGALSKSIVEMDKNVAAAISAIHIRVAVIEATKARRKT